MLLIIEALLLISAALGQDHRDAAVPGQIYSLDMALNSVDDQYIGCTENMTNIIKTEKLESEKNNSSVFNEAWQEGKKKSTSPENNLTESHSIAIFVYTVNDSRIYSNFNNAVYKGKQNYTENKFMWYSLHFLLTTAIQILKKTQDRCCLTYRGTQFQYKESSVLNQEVRFGSFASSSFNRIVAESFGSKTCFEIYTCEGADVTKYSKYPYQKEVLIPPYETFKITAVKKKQDQNDLWCETVFVLNSTRKKSDLNCGTVVTVFNSGNHVSYCELEIVLALYFLCFLDLSESTYVSEGFY
ncbi:ecto-ADP-ribosyltransferase 5-like [Garra rufa]|uniref:ecto-ADP-ribosyltransferase 5-like n=1 Tax=Garra rufa TaxID=137080 RepID=UPI003CCEAAF6